MEDKIKDINVLIMDVDGVLTDGRMILSRSGEELKFFDVLDGFGVTLWRKAGHRSAIITANESAIVLKRANILKVDWVHQKIDKKLQVYEKIKQQQKLSDRQICYIGDDLLDLPVLKKAGFSCCVPNACDEIKTHVDYVTKKEGGRGAVREVIDLILKVQNLWDKVTEEYRT